MAPMDEFTTVFILPDAVKRNLVSEIVGRFEKRGYAIIGLKMVHFPKPAAEARYAGVADAGAKVASLIDGASVALVVQGPGCIGAVVKMVGALPAADAAPGTLRGDLANPTSSAIVECAADAATARAEAQAFFAATELTEPVLHKCEKIVDKLNAWSKTHTEPYVSFEYFPPKTPAGVQTLYKTLDAMAKQEPLFFDFTWGAGGSTSALTMELCSEAYKRHGLDINMHLTCTNQDPQLCAEALAEAKRNGIRNIVALRGDPPKGQEKWEAVEGGFTCALDLVKFIRANFGDFFGIQVSGYPEGHPDVIKPVEDLGRPLTASEKKRLVVADGKEYVCSDADFERELDYLKAKIDAGGDAIITQMFFDYEVFEAFVHACRARGIKAPILPGIMLIAAHGGFTRMTGFCKSRVPADLKAKCDELKDDPEGFKAMGLQYCADLCKKILEGKLVDGLHFYTLNQSPNTFAVMDKLGLMKAQTESIEEGDTLKGTHIA